MPPVKSRRAEYTESTRDAVLDSAAELFARQGYAHTSLDQIAAAARVTKGAIYHHFENKAALMTALVERMELVANGRLREVFAREADRRGALAGGGAVIDGFLENCSDPAYGRLVFQEAPLALGWQEWQRCQAQFGHSLIEEVFGRCVREGSMPGPVPFTLVRVMFGLLATAGQLMVEAAEPDMPRVRRELRATFHAFTLALATTDLGTPA